MSTSFHFDAGFFKRSGRTRFLPRTFWWDPRSWTWGPSTSIA